MAETYTCALCNGVFEFEEEWTDGDAVQEMEEIFPGIPKEECDIICDDCFKKVMMGTI
jgi:hypothetical protein